MSKHKMVDGRLLQMDKSFGQLKQKQREKIAEWMYQAYKKQVKEGLSEDDALQLVFDQIEEAKISYTIGVGDTVRINTGLFRGCECKVQRVSDDFKTLTVLVPRGARMMAMEIASSQVEKIG